MNLGLMDMIGLAASLIFAIPLGNYAIIRLLDGDVALGVGLLVVAIAMVVLPQYFLDPGRILRGFLAGLLPRQLQSGSPEAAEASEATEALEATEAAEASEAAENDLTESDSVVADVSLNDRSAGDDTVEE